MAVAAERSMEYTALSIGCNHPKPQSDEMAVLKDYSR
jgi:hypothetical protein